MTVALLLTDISISPAVPVLGCKEPKFRDSTKISNLLIPLFIKMELSTAMKWITTTSWRLRTAFVQFSALCFEGSIILFLAPQKDRRADSCWLEVEDPQRSDLHSLRVFLFCVAGFWRNALEMRLQDGLMFSNVSAVTKPHNAIQMRVSSNSPRKTSLYDLILWIPTDSPYIEMTLDPWIVFGSLQQQAVAKRYRPWPPGLGLWFDFSLLFFFCSQAVGSCNLVLLVHLLGWDRENLYKYFRIGAMPIVQVTQMRRD